MNTKIKEPQFVVWIQTAFLGDILLSTGAFRLLKKHKPHIKQILITTPIGQKALNDFRDLDHILAFDKKSNLKGMKEIKSQILKLGLDLKNGCILQIHKSIRSSILAHYLQMPIITYYETSLSYWADFLVPRVAILHESIRASLLLEALNITREEITQNKLYLPPLDNQKFTFLNSEKLTIAIAPGSTWGTKRWPKEKFLQLINLLLDQLNIQIVLLGGKEEISISQYLYSQAEKKEHIFDLTGKTSLDDLRAIYPNLKLLITNDSSPIHYASCFNVPTIAIFGATTPEMGFGPLAKHSKVVETPHLKCRPCSDHGPQTCPIQHFECMQKIESTSAYNSILEIVDIYK